MDTHRDDENISDANSRREAYNSMDTNSETPKTIQWARKVYAAAAEK
jgi:hypothetical protein